MNESRQLQQLLHAPGAPSANWRQISEVIEAEFIQATTSAERVSLLEAFATATDTVAATLCGSERDAFQESQLLQYNLLIMREAVIGNYAGAQTLNVITTREIAAGRMTTNNTLAKIADERSIVSRLACASETRNASPRIWHRARAIFG